MMKTLSGLGLLLTASNTLAISVTSELYMDEVKWRYQKQTTECRISSQLPHTQYQVAFTHRPESPIEFKIASLSDFNSPISHVALTTVSPIWSSEDGQGTIVVANDISNNAVSFDKHIDNVMAELGTGKWLQLTARVRGQDTLVTIPTIGFSQVADDFYQCVGEIPKLKFETIDNLKFLFVNGQSKPNKKQLRELDKLVDYLLKDPSITKILVDGHSDSVGNNDVNRRLSMQRADEVSHYLISKGISKDMFVVRGHGSRYPEFSNDTQEGRNKNRRVTIRLVKR